MNAKLIVVLSVVRSERELSRFGAVGVCEYVIVLFRWHMNLEGIIGAVGIDLTRKENILRNIFPVAPQLFGVDGGDEVDRMAGRYKGSQKCNNHRLYEIYTSVSIRLSKFS